MRFLSLFHSGCPARGACLLLSSVLLVTGFSSGCSTSRYRKSADLETYRIIEEKGALVPGMEPEFTVEMVDWNPLEGLPVNETVDEALGTEAQAELGAAVVDLEHALRIAFTNSRTYQNQKEALYLDALALTLDRHRYTPIFTARGGVQTTSSVTEAVRPTSFAEAMGAAGDLITQIEAVTGTPAEVLSAYHAVVEQAGVVTNVPLTETVLLRDQDLSAQSTVGVDLLLRGGGRIALNLTNNFFQFLTGDSRGASSSLITGVFTQPLLRGAGADIVTEHLTQAERNVMYGIRDFTRFRQEFAVQVAANYYNVLQDRDIVENSYQSYDSYHEILARTRALHEEGRLRLAELGRVEQELLSTENQWNNSVRRYRESLDQFKILLGLSTDADIVLDEAELAQLRDQGLQHPVINAEDAVEVALVSRLDLYNNYDVTDDAGRRVHVAANALKPGLNLLVSSELRSHGRHGFMDFDVNRVEWGAGLDLDLPMDRKAERNQYRASLIAYERALRQYALAVDQVKFDVRANWRNLEQALRNYQNARQRVELSQRRVEEQELRLELGQVTAIDQVDAQNALTSAQNDLTSALVSHTISRLQFWRDMGILYIKPDGQWEDVSDDFVQHVPAAEFDEMAEDLVVTPHVQDAPEVLEAEVEEEIEEEYGVEVDVDLEGLIEEREQP